MRMSVSSLFTFVGGAIVLADSFIEAPFLAVAASKFLSWSVLIGAFSAALGGANIVAVHWKRLSAKSPNWGLSLVLIGSMLAWLGVGLSQGISSNIYRFIWNNVYGSLSATMFALNAFFIASAAYRSFRVKGAETLILLLTASIVMLGRTGLGEALYPKMPLLADWLMRVPNTAGMRGITIGGALGAISVSARVILGLERGTGGLQ